MQEDSSSNKAVIAPEIQKLEALIQKSAYTKAEKQINEILTHESVPIQTELWMNYFNSLILTRRGEFKQGLNLATTTRDKAEKDKLWQLVIQSQLIIIEALWRLGQTQKAFKEAQKGEDLLQKNNYFSSIENINKKQAKFLWLKGLLHQREGDLNEAFQCHQKSYKIFDSLDCNLDAAYCLNALGVIDMKRGNLKGALEYFKKCLQINKKLKNTRGIAQQYNNIGVIYREMGELDQALKYIQKDLALRQDSGEQRDVAYSLCNIAMVYQLKGDLDQALKFATESLEIREKIEEESTIAYTLRVIGDIHQKRGEITKAYEAFQKSLQLNRKLHDDIAIAESLYKLIILASENKLGETEKFLEELQTIAEENDNKLIEQQYQIAKAIILKSANRTIKRAKAQEIFLEVSQKEVVKNELTVYAMINLAELLLEELQLTSNKEVLKEFKTLIGKLLEIARNQHSSHLLALTYLLQSKLSLLEFNVNKAQELLTEAQQIAITKNLNRLAMKISNEYDLLLDQLEKWDEISKRKSSISERVELTKLDQILTEIIQKGAVDVPAVSSEEPIFLIILTKDGLTFHSQKFVSQKEPDDMLVAGFLTAINSFMKETFAAKGNIERIKHQEFTILFIQEGDFIFCYVFKGQSFSALQKLEEFIEEVTKKMKPLLNGFLTNGEKPNEAEKEKIELLCKESFLEN
jgi:tetratricopeptide (TPR) repeat protein